VRLGMSGKEAIAAIKQHFNASDEQISFREGPSSLRPGQSIISYVGYKKISEDVLWVVFQDRIPLDDARPEYAVDMKYRIDEFRPDELKQMRQAALEKYGPPTIVGKVQPFEQWCAKIESRRVFGGPDGCVPEHKPVLVLRRNGLELVDGSYAEKLSAAAEQMKGKPKL
jgi:hypothetical protein